MKVQEALKAAIEALKQAKDNINHNEGKRESNRVWGLYDDAERLCKSALSDIEKCEPVANYNTRTGETKIFNHKALQNSYGLTKIDFYTSPISKEWVGISEERLLRLILAYRNVDDLLKVVTAELKQLNVPEKG